MRSRICICCGDSFSNNVNEMCDNPNICAACSQMAGEVDAVEFEVYPAAPEDSSRCDGPPENHNGS